MGRGNFIKLRPLYVKEKNKEISWNFLRFVVFDCPPPSNSQKLLEKYEQRYENLLKIPFKNNNPFIIPSLRIRCADKTCIF